MAEDKSRGELKKKRKITSPGFGDFSTLVRHIYLKKGVRPLSKAMAEASERWGKIK